MPLPPSFQKVNPADFPILFLTLSSETLPLPQINEYAEINVAQRISTIKGVAQANIFGSQKFAVQVEVDPRQLAARGLDLDRRGVGHQPEQREPADRNALRSGSHVCCEDRRTAGERVGIPSAHRQLPRRPPGPARRDRQRLRRGRKRQADQLVQRHADDLSGHQPPAGRQHGRGGRRHPHPDPADPEPAARLAVTRHSPGPLSVDSGVHSRHQADARTHGGAGRAGDLPVPAECLGDRHSEPGAAGIDHRHVRGDAPARLQHEQPFAHGAHAVGRLRRRRRDRHAREHRAPHGARRERA